MTVALPTSFARNAERTWRFPATLAGGQIAFMGLLCGGFYIVVGGIIAASAYWGDVQDSIWEEAATQAPRWFVLFVGGWVAQTILPFYIAQGRTRRDFAIEVALFVAVYAAAGTVMLVAGFGLEAIYYEIGGWSQEITGPHLFDSVGEVHLMAFEYFVLLAEWTLAGLLIGAAWYRSDVLGPLSIVVALIPAMILEAATGAYWGPMLFVSRQFFDIGEPPLVVALLVSPLCLAALGGAAWLVIRDIPMQNKSS